MKTSNIPSGAQRQADVGLVWREKITNAMASIKVPIQGTIRVRATGATTVSLDGILAITMMAGEIEVINVGSGLASNNVKSVVVTIAGAAAFVQVAEENDTGRVTV